jgi:4'-phosphopantetheinyl transferase EntD
LRWLGRSFRYVNNTVVDQRDYTLRHAQQHHIVRKTYRRLTSRRRRQRAASCPQFLEDLGVLLAALFPKTVHAAAVASDTAALPTLLPEEAVSIRRAVERRRRDFAAGRACARWALEKLGIMNYPLLAGPDRAPVWPEGVVGSITHCPGFAGAVVARREAFRGIGVDAELSDPLDPQLVDLVCTLDERIRLTQLRGLPPNGWAKVVFSAKEAVYKCLSSAAGVALDFADVEIRLVPDAGRFTAYVQTQVPEAVPTRLEGRFAIALPHVLTGVVLP